MTALPRRRRNRTVAMMVATLVVAASIPVLGYVGVNAVLDSTGGRDALEDNLPTQSFPSTPAALYLTTDDEGTLATATVFVLAPSGAGGSIISVPVNADVDPSAADRRSLQQVFAEGGLDLMAPTIESLLLLTINFSAQSDPAQLTTFLTPFQPLTVDLADPVPAQDDQSALAPGTAVLSAADAARVLTAGAGQGSESARQGNIEALWRALVASVGSGRAPSTPLTADPATFDDFVTHLVAAQTQTRGLSGEPFAANQNPDEVDAIELDKYEAVFVFASVAPGSMAAPALGPMLRLEAPPGYDVKVRRTIEILLFLKANVISVDTTAEPRTDTVFLVPDEANRIRVQTTDAIFGEISFGEPTVRIDGVDATIQLGTEFLDGLEL